MKTKRLGNSELEITTLGIGSWAIGGGGWQFGWGNQDDAESIRTIHKAIDAGMNWIDTAAVYGFGHSEEMVAKAVKTASRKPFIFTKCGLEEVAGRQTRKNLKADFIRTEVENSLRRFDGEAIDLYQIHWPAENLEEGWETLVKLKQEGKVRYIGVSNFDRSQLERISQIGGVTSLQPPYSLLNREIEKDILPYCQANNIGVIVYSPMASGLLSGKMTAERVANMPADDWRKKASLYQQPRLDQNLKFAGFLAEIGKKYEASAGEIAIAWTLVHKAVTGAIVGLRHENQVDEVLKGGSIELSEEDIKQIELHIPSEAEVHA